MPYLQKKKTKRKTDGYFKQYNQYISPLLQVNGGFCAGSISMLMILAGLGMVIGNQVIQLSEVK